MKLLNASYYLHFELQLAHITVTIGTLTLLGIHIRPPKKCSRQDDAVNLARLGCRGSMLKVRSIAEGTPARIGRRLCAYSVLRVREEPGIPEQHRSEDTQ